MFLICTEKDVPVMWIKMKNKSITAFDQYKMLDNPST